MNTRQETPFRPQAGILASEFRRGRSYTNWRPHGSGDWLLIYTLAGAGRIGTETESFIVRPGECVLYAPSDYQEYGTDPKVARWQLLWSHFVPRPSWHAWLHWPVNSAGLRTLHLDPGEVRGSFVRALQRTIRIIRRRLPNAEDFAANALEEALLWAHLAASRRDWTQMDQRVRKAMDYLAANVRQPFRLETLSRHCGLSVSRLAHLFKSEAGVSPQRFFEQQRMRHAGQLLRGTGLSIAEVAAETGYDDPFYFSNRFRRHAGKSPTDYRRRAKAV